MSSSAKFSAGRPLSGDWKYASTVVYCHIQILPARLQMSTRAGPIISVVTVCTTVSCHLVVRHLRSATQGDLDFPRTRNVTYGSRAFAVSSPMCWNALPPSENWKHFLSSLSFPEHQPCIFCLFVPCIMLVDLEVFYLGHLKNFYTIQCNTIPKVTVAEISTVLWVAEDNPHGAAAVTLCYKIRAWINTVH